jgi:hypothetical protein
MSERGSGRNEAAELVQAAALEAIKAMKAFLEVAEAVVREPATAATVGRAFAEAAASAMRSERHGPDDGGRDDDQMDEEQHPGRVRRIEVSD